MLVGVAIENVKKLISFFKEYRETGYTNALEIAKKIAIDMDVDPVFPQKRQIRRKRQFDESLDETIQSAQESFRINFFNCIIDQAIVSLDRRFEQYEQYKTLFGFMFDSDTLCSLDDKNLKTCCTRLAEALKNGDKSDFHECDLFVELKLLQQFLPIEGKLGAHEILRIMKRVDCFPNAIIVYRTLLTIPIIVASAERSFSKLKLIKTYLRNSISQDRLNGLAMVAIESGMLDNIACEDFIDEFALKNARRTRLFM